MKFINKISYVLSIIIIYTLLTVGGIFILKYLIEMFTFDNNIKNIIYLVYLLFFDTLITYLIGNKLSLKINNNFKLDETNIDKDDKID